MSSDLPIDQSKYKVYGSCGQGNWAETPWVAILDKSITSSTQYGYYVVLLFNTTSKTLFISLAVGWTQFEQNFKLDDAREKIRKYSDYFYHTLSKVPAKFKTGPIDLDATQSLGKGYEQGQIISKKYTVGQLDDTQLLDDTRDLLVAYQELSSYIGNEILNIDYKDVINQRKLNKQEQSINKATLNASPKVALEDILKIANALPPGRRKAVLNRIIRNPKISKYVKEQADYICTICGREPFVQKNGLPYAEADHIEPLGSEGYDTVENMRCLCAQCHAVITYGSKEEINRILSS